jgi:hypothetical protein
METMPMVENCANCAFGVRIWLHSSSEIQCHRHAPIVFHGVTGCKTRQIGSGPEYTTEDIMGAVTAWPTVSGSYFCGDWELQDVRS